MSGFPKNQFSYIKKKIFFLFFTDQQSHEAVNCISVFLVYVLLMFFFNREKEICAQGKRKVIPFQYFLTSYVKSMLREYREY